MRCTAIAGITALVIFGGGSAGSSSLRSEGGDTAAVDADAVAADPVAASSPAPETGLPLIDLILITFLATCALLTWMYQEPLKAMFAAEMRRRAREAENEKRIEAAFAEIEAARRGEAAERKKKQQHKYTGSG